MYVVATHCTCSVCCHPVITYFPVETSGNYSSIDDVHIGVTHTRIRVRYQSVSSRRGCYPY